MTEIVGGVLVEKRRLRAGVLAALGGGDAVCMAEADAPSVLLEPEDGRDSESHLHRLAAPHSSRPDPLDGDDVPHVGARVPNYLVELDIAVSEARRDGCRFSLDVLASGDRWAEGIGERHVVASRVEVHHPSRVALRHRALRLAERVDRGIEVMSGMGPRSSRSGRPTKDVRIALRNVGGAAALSDGARDR